MDGFIPLLVYLPVGSLIDIAHDLGQVHLVQQSAKSQSFPGTYPIAGNIFDQYDPMVSPIGYSIQSNYFYMFLRSMCPGIRL